jgi:hypothetical protein
MDIVSHGFFVLSTEKNVKIRLTEWNAWVILKSRLKQRRDKMNKAVYRIIKANGNVKYAGTDMPSWFNLENAQKFADKSNGEKIFEYDLKYQRALWEVC